MSKALESLLGSVNGSDFPFQLRIRHAINQSAASHQWSVASDEHRWIDPIGDEGFIDLIVTQGDQRIVIEAKRTAAKEQWIFLLPESGEDMRRAKAVWSICSGPDKPFTIAWSDFDIEPESIESYFCVVHGQDREKPMLERVAGILARSVEALAQEEAEIWQRLQNLNRPRIYIPLIVTNATLSVCQFDPSTVDLQTGEIEIDKAQIRTVSFVRFRKSLSTGLDVSPGADDLTKIDSELVRTVFVVNARSLLQFLQSFVIRPFQSRAWPWGDYGLQ